MLDECACVQEVAASGKANGKEKVPAKAEPLWKAATPHVRVSLSAAVRARNTVTNSICDRVNLKKNNKKILSALLFASEIEGEI